MRLSFLILIFAMVSSLSTAQNEDESKKSGMINAVEPEFIGLTEYVGIKEFIQENISYPAIAHKMGPVGSVVIQFQVSPSGNLSEYQVINSVSPDCDKAVINTLESTDGMWNPGSINGRSVSTEKEVTVVFKMDGIDMYMNAQLSKNKADYLLKKGKYVRAIKLYNTAIDACPHNHLVYYRRGLAKYYIGDMDGALNDFERVADLDSHLADPMLTKLNEVVDFANSELQLQSMMY